MLTLSYEACYESKTKLFTLSEIPIFEIFSDENAGNEVTDHMRHVMDDLVGFPDPLATIPTQYLTNGLLHYSSGFVK